MPQDHRPVSLSRMASARRSWPSALRCSSSAWQAEAYAEDETAADLLNAEQDTLQFYNGYEFRLSELKTVFPQMEGFHIANRKIYYRANGLWVANIDGAYPVQIDAMPCAAMTLDTKDNRIYWANSEGVWYMPFVGSDSSVRITISLSRPLSS